MLPGAAAGHISAPRAGRGVIQPTIRTRWGVGGHLPTRGSPRPPLSLGLLPRRAPQRLAPARSLPLWAPWCFKHRRPQTQTIIRGSLSTQSAHRPLTPYSLTGLDDPLEKGFQPRCLEGLHYSVLAQAIVAVNSCDLPPPRCEHGWEWIYSDLSDHVAFKASVRGDRAPSSPGRAGTTGHSQAHLPQWVEVVRHV